MLFLYFLYRPVNNHLLHIVGQPVEILRVPADADYQVPVKLRVLHRVEESLSRDAAHLHLYSAHLHVAEYQRLQRSVVEPRRQVEVEDRNPAQLVERERRHTPEKSRRTRPVLPEDSAERVAER